MDIGTEFVYEVRETVSDRDCIKFSKERYVLKEIRDDEYIFDRYRNGIFEEEVIGSRTYPNGHIRNDHTRKVCDVKVDTAYGTKELTHYSTNMCGGAIEIFTEGDLAYEWVERQMWSGGVIYEKRHALIMTSLLPRD